MELKTRKCNRFRTHIDPMIGSKPRNAFDLREFGPDSHFEITPIGVYVRIMVKDGTGTFQPEEHIVPYANVQSVRLAPLEGKDK